MSASVPQPAKPAKVTLKMEVTFEAKPGMGFAEMAKLEASAKTAMQSAATSLGVFNVSGGVTSASGTIQIGKHKSDL